MDAVTCQLLWHAGFKETEQGRCSISNCTGQVQFCEADIEWAVSDFINTLSAFNHMLNGNKPSEALQKSDSIQRRIVASVIEVISMLRESNRKYEALGLLHHKQILQLAVWRIETAWSAVVAGDIDDIPVHLRNEEMMREGQQHDSD